MDLNILGNKKKKCDAKVMESMLQEYVFYECFKCKKPYFGGKRVCVVNEISEFRKEDLICGACSDFSDTQICKFHGKEFLEYKCRFCCNVAVWFCWGTTHFCNSCHLNAAQMIFKKKNELPACSCNRRHPPNGEEWPLGCALCKSEK